MLRGTPPSSREPLILHRVERVSDFVPKLWLVILLLWLISTSAVLIGLALSRNDLANDFCFATGFNSSTVQCTEDLTITVWNEDTDITYSGNVKKDGFPGLEGTAVAINLTGTSPGAERQFSTSGVWPDTNTGVQLGGAIPCAFFCSLLLLLLHRHFILERDYTTQATLIFFLFCCTVIFLTAVVLDGHRISLWKSDESLCSVLSSSSENIYLEAGHGTAKIEDASCSFAIFYATMAFDVICFVSCAVLMAMTGMWAVGTAQPLSKCDDLNDK